MPPPHNNKRSKSGDSTEEDSSPMDMDVFGSTTVPVVDVDAWTAETALDLGFLKPLREDISDFFIPESLWVRQEMKDTMKELQENNKTFKRQVLIGSPGVGKSVLFFLYALVNAQDTGKKVMYWRKATADVTKINLFCIEALDDKKIQIRWNKTLIPFGDSIQDINNDWMQAAYPDLFKDVDSQSRIRFKGHITDLLINQVTMFVDGPKEKDTKDTMGGSVPFLCTSGGHPRPSNDQNTVLRVPVLCGWLKDPFLRCIKNYATAEQVNAIWVEQFGMDSSGDGNDEYDAAFKEDWVAELIYYYTGGRIRDGIKLLQGTLPFHQFEKDAKGMIVGLGKEALDLAATGQFGSKDKNRIDSLRTYFKVIPKVPGPEYYIQLVDSGYCLKLLSDRDMSEKYLNAYKEAVKLNDMTVAGQQFERMMHKVYEKLVTEEAVPFDGYTQAQGSTREGVQQISKEKYWVPSVPNFPAIDAAVWKGNNEIYCVQYFAGKQHGFNTRKFKTTFLNFILDNAGKNAVGDDICFVTYVTPSDQPNQKPVEIYGFHWRQVVIDVDTIETVMKSAPAAFAANGEGVPFEPPAGT